MSESIPMKTTRKTNLPLEHIAFKYVLCVVSTSHNQTCRRTLLTDFLHIVLAGLSPTTARKKTKHSMKPRCDCGMQLQAMGKLLSSSKN